MACPAWPLGFKASPPPPSPPPPFPFLCRHTAHAHMQAYCARVHCDKQAKSTWSTIYLVSCRSGPGLAMAGCLRLERQGGHRRHEWGMGTWSNEHGPVPGGGRGISRAALILQLWQWQTSPCSCSCSCSSSPPHFSLMQLPADGLVLDTW